MFTWLNNICSRSDNDCQCYSMYVQCMPISTSHAVSAPHFVDIHRLFFFKRHVSKQLTFSTENFPPKRFPYFASWNVFFFFKSTRLKFFKSEFRSRNDFATAFTFSTPKLVYKYLCPASYWGAIFAGSSLKAFTNRVHRVADPMCWAV